MSRYEMLILGFVVGMVFACLVVAFMAPGCPVSANIEGIAQQVRDNLSAPVDARRAQDVAKSLAP